MLALNDKLNWFVIHLHAAHVFENERMCEDAPLIALCPTCHWKFDHPKTESDFFFIGLVYQQFIEEGSKHVSSSIRICAG